MVCFKQAAYTQHISQTSWVASVAGVNGAAGLLTVQSWVGAGEQGVYAKHAPVEAERITMRGYDGYQYVSQHGAGGPIEIQIWWTDGLVIWVSSLELLDVGQLTAIIEEMIPVDAAGYTAFIGSTAKP